MFKFELVSPEKLIFSAKVTHVRVPGAEGEFGVLAQHSPVISVLRAGVLSVSGEDGEIEFFIRGGFADVTPDGLTVLAAHAITRDELTGDVLQTEIEHAQKALAEAADEASRFAAQAALTTLSTF